MIGYPWQKIPLFRIFLAYFIGLIVALTSLKGLIIQYPFCIGIGLLILSVVAHKITKRWKTWYWLPAFFIVMFFFGLGIYRVNTLYSKDDASHFSHSNSKSDFVLLQITKPPIEKSETIQVKGSVKGLIQDNQILPKKGRVIAYLRKDSLARQLKYGDLLIATNKFDTLDPPPNPKQFNLKAFLANKQIYHQAFLKPEDWHFTGENEGAAFFQTIYSIRHQLLDWLSAVITREDEKAVAYALLAGYKEAIDPELRHSYSSTGAMHVLAVSGLHVGIIYLMLNFGLSFLNPIRSGPYVKMLIIILILWIYACLTGLPASVIRASTMFTFVAIGSNMKRLTNVYGSILTSMFILLLINPFLITQVGFQLSYAAVLGIVFLQPKIYGLLPQPRFWLIDQIWAITAVSIAAQLSTFPLTLFYFNQFPSYFLISNLVVIPAAFLIVPTGFIFFLFKGLSYGIFSSLAYLFGNILDYLLYGLNYLIKAVQSLPYSLINEIFITTWEFWLIYLGLAGWFLGFIFRHKTWLAIGLFASLGLLTLINYHLWQNQQLSKLAFLTVNNHTVVASLKPGKIHLTGDPKALSNEEQLKFNTYRFFWSQGLSKKDIQKNPLSQDSTLKDGLENRALSVSQKRLFIIDDKTTLPSNPNCRLQIDHLLITGKVDLSRKKLLNRLRVKRVILGDELPPWEVKKWKKALAGKRIKCHSISQDGALVENL